MVQKQEIFDLIKKYYDENKKHPDNKSASISGKVFDDKEINAIVDAALDGWWTEGKYAIQFTKLLSDFLPIPYVELVNSGSSANLIAFSSLTSHLLPVDKRISPGDEVITVAAGFPTTINPIIQNQAIPVFLDVDLNTFNIDTSLLEDAISTKTKAIMLAHTLGNPFNIEKIAAFAKAHNLWFIEDNCDALGSEYMDQKTGTFGDLSTQSFYPAHHITTGEGGAIFTKDKQLDRIIRSIRDWGRDCWCATGYDATCNNRFGWKLGDLPEGYDHKYIYSHIGYNLKITDLNAAIGVIQMTRLNSFIKQRRDNFDYLITRFKEEHLDDYFILPKPTEKSNPAWFGFPLTITNQKIDRTQLMIELNKKKIGTRYVFGGNITRQPYFLSYNLKYRKVGQLTNTDTITMNSFWVGLYPGLDTENLNYLVTEMKMILKEM